MSRQLIHPRHKAQNHLDQLAEQSRHILREIQRFNPDMPADMRAKRGEVLCFLPASGCVATLKFNERAKYNNPPLLVDALVEALFGSP